MNDYRYEVSLRVTHPAASADEVCSLLRLDAIMKRSVGKVRTTNKGKSIPGVWSETYCGFEIDSTPEMPLAECLQRLLVLIKEREGSLRELQRSGGRASVYVLATPIEGTFGETLCWNTMRELALLELDLSMEIYGVN